MLELFYDPHISSDSFVPFRVTLSKEEWWHCAKVLRMRCGDTVFLTNGIGCLFRGTLKNVDAEGCQIVIQEINRQKPQSYYLHLAVSPLKQTSRFEWFVEKATEIGVNRITPLICERTEKVSIRTDRLKKIVIAAMKQSLGSQLPLLCEPSTFEYFVEQAHKGQCYIGW